MGRLPEGFAGVTGVPQRITFRTPWAMSATTEISSSTSGVQFAPDVFTHSTDRPFEIHRVIPRLYAVDSNDEIIDPQPAQELLFSCVQMRIQDFGKTQELAKSSTPISNLVKGTSEPTWEWAEPYYLVKDEGFIVTLDSIVYPFVNDTVRVTMTFQGYLLTLAPASDRR